MPYEIAFSKVKGNTVQHLLFCCRIACMLLWRISFPWENQKSGGVSRSCYVKCFRYLVFSVFMLISLGFFVNHFSSVNEMSKIKLIPTVTKTGCSIYIYSCIFLRWNIWIAGSEENTSFLPPISIWIKAVLFLLIL